MPGVAGQEFARLRVRLGALGALGACGCGVCVRVRACGLRAWLACVRVRCLRACARGAAHDSLQFLRRAFGRRVGGRVCRRGKKNVEGSEDSERVFASMYVYYASRAHPREKITAAGSLEVLKVLSSIGKSVRKSLRTYVYYASRAHPREKKNCCWAGSRKVAVWESKPTQSNTLHTSSRTPLSTRKPHA